MPQMVYQMHQIQISNFETNGLPWSTAVSVATAPMWPGYEAS